ncbi:hypothetical protein [Clostridium sp.]
MAIKDNNTYIRVKVTKEENQTLKNLAKKKGISVSKLVNNLIIDFINKES